MLDTINRDKLYEDVTNLHDKLITGGLGNISELPHSKLELPEVNINEFSVPNIQKQQLDASNISTKEAAQSVLNWFSNATNIAPDPMKYAKVYGYNSGHRGYNFNRYVSVPRVYKEVGFSPWKDNEAIYNEKITGFEDFKRSLVYSAYLAGSSFNSMLPWKANPIFGDGEMTDLEGAYKSEEYNMTGASSKHGVVGFVNNLTLNTGFMTGMALEFGTEQLLSYLSGLALSPFTAGGSLAVAGANTINDVRKGTSLLKAGKTIENLGKLTLDSEKLLNGVKNITKAR